METFKLVREIPMEDGYDVVVAGGGPAGSAAAVSAARLGAKVLLVEGTGSLGGMGTSGLVCAFDPMANGERNLAAGFILEVVERMNDRGYVLADPENWRSAYHRWTEFRSEGLKLVLDEMMQESGVEVRFFTRVIDAQVEGDEVKGVVLSNIEGYTMVRAKTFIDCTGDAVLSQLCGADYYEAGRDTEHIMPATLTALFANVHWGEEHLKTQCPETVALIEKEYEEGNFAKCDRHFVGISRVGQSVGYMNGGHIFDLNAVKVKSLTEGMMEGRRTVREYERFMKKYSPDCKDIELVATGALMGVRESRRIVGEYTLTVEDYLARRQFPDQIGVFNKFIDIHPYDCSREEYDRLLEEKDVSGRLEPGECFGIPYGVTVNKGFRNLWTAGRCVSSDVKVQGSIRVMPTSAMMGQAAGTAAAMAAETGCSSCEVDTAELVKTLRKYGAYLPQEELSREMTRD